ncbi:HAD-IC family P-type ATPase [Marinilactibacillus psychrotolerans]|uniref:Cation-transporting ATPase n=1 Tax=Marinilactibacillus psychrotolerans TaxID=191770 RepID=A0AAV3WQA7_9LACT|nr:HAD-IC family P-type ATPase [Marinilactibacillus psychrotolerans]GEL67180.1 cation-transporting ATPase [Marinilactibacillus psychrotolerans]GEQ35407.1 cation-transporting ATPase [Marinilactibacillus psychrotolerans]SDC90341.1 ATPase, P-type (transporting), HAD superfamily, subfamily IC [Marinilactibacillus psychrotolerans]
MENKEEPYYQKSKKELADEFTVDLTEGLSSDEAEKRLKEDGLNKLEEKKTSKWTILLRQINNVVIYILIVAAILTVWMGHYSDAIVIGLVVVANTLIGYFQEVNASNALDKIKDMLSTHATVIRDGQRKEIEAVDVVKGDVVYLEAGDNVPADLRIVDSDSLKVQEASLTGEADSIEKTPDEIEAKVGLGDQINMAFASTSITNGNGTGIVIATAEETEIGKISTAVNDQESKKTPLVQVIDNLGKTISYVIMGVAALLFVYGLISGVYSLSALSLAVVTMIVGSVPEGLPATTSVVLAMGVSDMAKNKNTIVKKLPSVETLGSVDIIATDKTGTLTKNEMTAQNIITKQAEYTVSGIGYSPDGEIELDGKAVELDSDPDLRILVTSGFEANETELKEEEGHWTINGEPTDGAFLTLYNKAMHSGESLYEEIAKVPFDSDYRYVATLSEHRESKERKIFIKGSPDKLFTLAKAQDSSFDTDFWREKVEALSSQGKRVVAVGVRDVDQNQQTLEHEDVDTGVNFLGIVGIIDPPREEIIESLKVMKKAGVEVKMITGDHPTTAKAIAEALGLSENVQTITGLELDELSQEELIERVNDYQVFARTTPHNKLQIIEAFQKSGKTTAMTGDGVNDAPALKKADIGVAMGLNGTDVSKDSADMVLTDDDFSTMSTAIEEGRRIYDNIKKSILYLLPTSFAEGLIIAFTLVAQRDLPLQATQMLWINMVSAITIQFAFIFEPAEPGLMDRNPRDTSASLIGKHDAFQIAYVSILMAGFSLIAYDWLIASGANQVTASTMVVNIIVISKIFYLFNVRTHALAFSKEFFTNKKAFLIIGVMILLQLILTYVPFFQEFFYTEGLTIVEWLIAIGVGVIVLIIAEIDKIIRMKVSKN